MSLAIIPARGGSKRIPRKNIRIFCGRPVLAWTIDAVAASACFERIVVSTDDPEVAAVARDCGAEVPFMRPVELANDNCGTTPVVAHAIEMLATSGFRSMHTCCIYPTAALIDPQDLRDARALLEKMPEIEFVVPIVAYEHPVQRAMQLDSKGCLHMLQPEHAQTRSQDLPSRYHDAGQFYWGHSAAWSNHAAILGSRTAALVLPASRVQDIDTPDDWIRAEALFRWRNRDPLTPQLDDQYDNS